MNVTTRIAPSPTGYLHFGLARTALFCYLYAKKNGGTYILRIEDTDTARNKPEYEADIHEQFRWLGLVPDKTFKQSEHVARHRELLQGLIDKDLAYVSREPAKDDPSREVEVVRLRNKGETITFTDLIRGEITFDTTELGDFVIARAIDLPLYHLAVVIDDNDEGVTHVIRGEDHISNTQRHILIQRALGFATPQYAHLPLILMQDKSKMSKRREGSSVKYYRDDGILPEALINYIALLGWNPGTDQEIFTKDELVNAFEIEQIHKSGAVFDPTKLHWYNREYLNKLSDDDFYDHIKAILSADMQGRGVAYDEGMARRLLHVIRERMSTYTDLKKMIAEGDLDYFFREPAVTAERLSFKDTPADETARHLDHVRATWAALNEEIFASPERLKESVWQYATDSGRGNVLWPVRFALSGRERSPDPFMIASILGKDKTLVRLTAARDSLAL